MRNVKNKTGVYHYNHKKNQNVFLNTTLKKNAEKTEQKRSPSKLAHPVSQNLGPDMPAEAMTRIASKAKVVPQTVKMGLGKLLECQIPGGNGGYGNQVVL